MRRSRRNSWQRPCSLLEVVAWSETSEDIGYNLADFLDQMSLELRKRTGRKRLLAAIAAEPPSTGKPVQDAYLAAVAAHLAHQLRLPPPRWVDEECRRLRRPWFALPDQWARAGLLRDSPAAVRERNLFTTEDALRRI